MAKHVAVEGLTLTAQGIVTLGNGTLEIVSAPSAKMSAEGKGVYKAPLQFTLIGADATGFDPGTVATDGPASINASVETFSVEGALVIRVDDNNPTVKMTGTINGTPAKFIEPWKITSAGQSTVLAD